MPCGISQRNGKILMVKATKRIRISADRDITLPWLKLRRNRPRFFSLSATDSFDNVSLIPCLSHLSVLVDNVFYLILRLAIANYHESGLFMLSEKSRTCWGCSGCCTRFLSILAKELRPQTSLADYVQVDYACLHQVFMIIRKKEPIVTNLNCLTTLAHYFNSGSSQF